MYATTDLATIVDRARSIDPDLVLYIVDQRQHLHFEQVFRAAIKAGLNGKARLEHLGFGTMNGPDGKPFKTRAGGVMKLADLIRMTIEAADARLAEAGIGKDYPAEERADIARMVGIAALKFADLSNHRIQNYVFDLERFTRFEGKTGPYLLYAAVRVKSMLRKAADQGDRPAAIVAPVEGERDLMLTLARLPEAISGAYDGRAPNELCAYAYDLAQSFSGWYGNFHVLSEPDADRRRGRLALADLALRQIVLVLDLLGIEVPERM
jgi:arginyl-tRNA synthetase